MSIFSDVDSTIDQIIALASSLKGHVGGCKGKFDDLIAEKEAAARKVHGDLEALQKQYEQSTYSSREEREKLEALIRQKEAEQAQKLAELDSSVKRELEAREKAEREAEEHKGNAAAERARLQMLLNDLEDDAMSYDRLRPSKPLLNNDEVNIIRQMFLSNAVKGSGKISFSELKQILTKYNATAPEGALKKLFLLVENDTKGRMSYITLVAVTNDLVALVEDFRKIDSNGNNVLSRKEFREYIHKIGFQKKHVVDAVFRYADEDESDEVTFSEYIHLALALLVLRILFTFADYDKSGALSKEEVLRVASDAHIPQSALNKFDHYFSIVDQDDNKTLSYQEFVMLVLTMFSDD